MDIPEYPFAAHGYPWKPTLFAIVWRRHWGKAVVDAAAVSGPAGGGQQAGVEDKNSIPRASRP